MKASIEFRDLRRGEIKILTGNSNPALADRVCELLAVERCNARVGVFANGETDIKIIDNVRGNDVFIVHPTCGNGEDCNVNRAVIELLLLIHTVKLASARRITAVIPHYGYARQDRKTQSRVPISASAVAKMITEVGVDSVITVDLHCGQIQGFFHGTPVTDLNPAADFAEYAKAKKFDTSRLAVVAPDAGAMSRARRFCDRIGASRIVTILKRRVEAGKVDSMQLVGEVKGCCCIIVDDIIDTAGTLIKAVNVLTENGATEVHAYATHGLLTDPACSRINDCKSLVEVVVSDSVPQAKNIVKSPKLHVISMATLLSECIARIHSEENAVRTRYQSVDAMPKAQPEGAAINEEEFISSDDEQTLQK